MSRPTEALDSPETDFKCKYTRRVNVFCHQNLFEYVRGVRYELSIVPIVNVFESKLTCRRFSVGLGVLTKTLPNLF